MRYGIVIEKADRNFSAYVPDLPGCVTTGNSIDDVKQNIREAIELHLQGLVEDGVPIPAPTTVIDYIDVSASAA